MNSRSRDSAPGVAPDAAADAAPGVATGVRRAVASAVVMAAAMIGLGLLVTKTLHHAWPFTVEDGVNRTLAAHRTGFLNTLSSAFSTGASTFYAIGIAAVMVLLVRWRFGRWREAVFLASAVALEASVFLVTTMVVDRPRPAVPELDSAPPTSSFPSGHTAAAMALYGGLALLATRRGSGRRAWWWLLLLIPAAVGASRLYRGMHHPSDVAAALLLGTAAILVARYAVLGSVPGVATARSRVGRRTTARIPRSAAHP